MGRKLNNALAASSTWRAVIGSALCILLTLQMPVAHASPSGEITVGRDVPARNISQIPETGKTQTIATGREDLISNSLGQSNALNNAPQALSDTTLNDVGSPNAAIAKSNAAIQTVTGTAGDNSIASQHSGSASISGSVRQAVGGAAVSGAVNRSLIPLSNMMSILPGGK